MNFERLSYTYDSNENKLTQLQELWQTNVWMNDWKYTYSYDANGNSLSGKYEKWQSGNWQPNTGSLALYSQNGYMKYFSGIYRYEASFHSFINGISNITFNNSSLAVYPNPASEKITVENGAFSEKKEGLISIYNIHGESLVQQPLVHEKTEIDISRLAKGIYVLKLRCGIKTDVIRFVK